MKNLAVIPVKFGDSSIAEKRDGSENVELQRTALRVTHDRCTRYSLPCEFGSCQKVIDLRWVR